MTAVLKNNASTTNAADILSTDTSFVVQDGSVFPTLASGQWFYVTLQSPANNREIMKVTGVSGNTLTVVRGQENTLAIPFPPNSRVELRVTVQNIYDLIAELSNDAIGW